MYFIYISLYTQFRALSQCYNWGSLPKGLKTSKKSHKAGGKLGILFEFILSYLFEERNVKDSWKRENMLTTKSLATG